MLSLPNLAKGRARNRSKFGTWGMVLSWVLNLDLSLSFPLRCLVKPHNCQVTHSQVTKLEASVPCDDRAETGKWSSLATLPWIYLMYTSCLWTSTDNMAPLWAVVWGQGSGTCPASLCTGHSPPAAGNPWDSSSFSLLGPPLALSQIQKVKKRPLFARMWR